MTVEQLIEFLLDAPVAARVIAYTPLGHLGPVSGLDVTIDPRPEVSLTVRICAQELGA